MHVHVMSSSRLVQALFGFVQADNDNQQPAHQVSEALHQVTTPGSTFGDVAPLYNQLAITASPMYAAAGHQHFPCQALQQASCSALQEPSYNRAASAVHLNTEPQKELFPAGAPTLSLTGARPPLADRQPTPQAVNPPPHPPFQLAHPHAATPGQAAAPPLHSFRQQSLPPQSVPVASMESYSTSLPQQRHLPSGQWVHPTERRGMLPTGAHAQVPLSSTHAQPTRGLSSARDAMPDVSYSTCTWSVPPQLQSHPYAMTTPQSSLTATPATSGWAVSHLGPQSLHPRPHTLGPHPSLPPRHPTPRHHHDPQSSHVFPGQGNSVLPPNRPPSSCDHPSFAHLDLSRPLCLQQPAVFGHPGSSGSYSASPHLVEAQRCFQQSVVSGSPGSLGNYPHSASPYIAHAQPSLQQHPSSAVADVHHLQQLQQPCEGDQQGGRRWPLDLQAQQQAQGQGDFLAGCYPQQLRGQPQPPISPVYPATCAVSQPQLRSCMPTGVPLQTTLAWQKAQPDCTQMHAYILAMQP